MDLLQSLRGPYLKSVRERVAGLEAQVLAARDQAAYKELWRVAHSLRGSSGFYGFTEIYAAACSLEEMTKAAASNPEVVLQSDMLAATQALLRAVKTAD